MSIKYSEILADDQILSAGDDDIIVVAIVDGISSTGYTTKAIKKLNLIPDPLFTSLTTTGTTGASTLVAGVLNIPTYGGGIVNSVTGLNTDNTDPVNPIINIAVDGVTITGSGTSIDPLVSTGIGGSGTTNYIARWTPDGITLGDSVIQDDGITLGINTAPAAFAKVWIASTDNSYGLYTGASSSATDTFGVYGACETSKAFDNVGVFGRARSSTTANYGVIGLAGSSSGVFGLSTGEYVGVYGIANNAVGVNHAAYLRADADTTQTNYGLFINVANAGAGDHYIGKFIDGNQALGKVLTSDALGNASWEDNNGDGIYGGPGTIPAALIATLTNNIELAANLNGEAAFTLSNTGVLGRSKIKIIGGTESMSLYTTTAQGHIISSNDPNGLHIVSTTANTTMSSLAGTIVDITAVGDIQIVGTADLGLLNTDFLNDRVRIGSTATFPVKMFVQNTNASDEVFVAVDSTNTNSMQFGENGVLYASSIISVGNASPSSASRIQTLGDIEITQTTAWYYLGDPTTDGSWRFGTNAGADFLHQKREVGVWVTKQTIAA